MRRLFQNHKIMNGAIVLLTVLLLGNAAAFAMTMADDMSGWDHSEYSLLNRVENQDFAQLVQMMYTNEAYGVEATETMEECYAVAGYFEAASFAAAYESEGQVEKAAQYREKMAAFKEKMGALAYTADEIDALLKGGYRKGEI